MAANTIRRTRATPAAHVAPDVVLRFAGGLEVHPADCPRGISAYPHWQPGPDGRAVCRCTALAAETASERPDPHDRANDEAMEERYA